MDGVNSVALPSDPAPYDAVLLLSFGGPERPEDVIPFLENVTRGRGIPTERLEAVAGHYHRFGGRSPINDQNRALLSALRAEFDARGLRHLPVYWGNRNWDPYLVDALRTAHDAGARRVAVLVTSAYASYSGCRQYRENLADALAELKEEGRTLAVDKIRHYFNHPGFVEPAVDAVIDALGRFGPPGSPSRDRARLLFVTHSVPSADAAASGPNGGAYIAQHEDVAASVAAAVSVRTGHPAGWDLAYCSRSGPPAQPWLEPDANDRLRMLHADGVPSVVVVPIGFVSDHVEVAFDLDIEARGTAAELGIEYVRAATAGADPRFVAALAGLVLERAATTRGGSPQRVSVGRLGASPDVCPAGCCRNPWGERPAACETGADR